MADRGVCRHEDLLLECSPWAEEAGFERPDPAKRLAARTKTGRNPLAARGKSAAAVKKLSQEAAERDAPSFPGPLLLPKDELNWDPDYPAQPFKSWLAEPERNKLTPERKTLYVAAPPVIASGVDFMNQWVRPTTTSTSGSDELELPSADAAVEYLKVFYHGLSVKLLPQQLKFVPWKEPLKRKRLKGETHGYVGLMHDDCSTRIRTRETPDKTFKRQLDLNDILDAAIAMLPDDAYSIVLLMNFDLYEDADDDFCCGRAYGGSRVCVVSSARYHPDLHADESLDPEHMWPASHCKKFADSLCAVEGLEPKEHSRSVQGTSNSPLRKAVEAIRGNPGWPAGKRRSGLWFSCMARTMVHELGHCFGMDHCVYYACNMQGTSGIAEDLRQPPYLCPVCLEKMAHGIACELRGGDQGSKEQYIRDRYEASGELCEKWKEIDLFSAYGAWIQAHIQLLET